MSSYRVDYKTADGKNGTVIHRFTTRREAMAFAVFHPQVWINDYAIEVDPEGDTVFEVGHVPEGVKDDSDESDRLREHAAAPQWIKDWSGPFWIEIIKE